MSYTVRQLAKIAGVSPRTLHYYDEIGLLEPERNPDNGYRVYDRAALLRLQQILYLRELGLSLEAIQAVLDRPEFDLLHALEQHRLALLARQERLSKLIRTVERTISHMKGNIEMESNELFEGFSEEKQKAYEEEAARRWGEKEVKESQKRWGSYSADEKKRILAESGEIYRDAAAAIPLGPSSPEAQRIVARWHQNLRYFYEPSVEGMAGLADGYVEDPEFNAFFQRIHPQLAEFMRQAIHIYCQA